MAYMLENHSLWLSSQVDKLLGTNMLKLGLGNNPTAKLMTKLYDMYTKAPKDFKASQSFEDMISGLKGNLKTAAEAGAVKGGFEGSLIGTEEQRIALQRAEDVAKSMGGKTPTPTRIKHALNKGVKNQEGIRSRLIKESAAKVSAAQAQEEILRASQQAEGMASRGRMAAAGQKTNMAGLKMDRPVAPNQALVPMKMVEKGMAPGKAGSRGAEKAARLQRVGAKMREAAALKSTATKVIGGIAIASAASDS